MQSDEDFKATMRPTKSGRNVVTLFTYEERKQVLNQAIPMDDTDNHRTSSMMGCSTNGAMNGNGRNMEQMPEQELSAQPLPPPPPQFANAPLTNMPELSTFSRNYQTISRSSHKDRFGGHNVSPPAATSHYGNIEFKANKATNGHNNNNTNSNNSMQNQQQRVRLGGTVTIGEYHTPMRKEPHKLDFLSPSAAAKQPNSPAARNSASNSPANYSSEPLSLRSELKNTLSRSNLKQAPPSDSNYGTPNVGQLTRQMQASSMLAGGAAAGGTGKAAHAPNGGILKNGNNFMNAHKSSEKSISFGN